MRSSEQEFIDGFIFDLERKSVIINDDPSYDVFELIEILKKTEV